MKKYSEYTESDSVDWGSIIKLALLEKTEICDNLENLANSWKTCSVGQLDINVPRNSIGEPKDAILKVLGIKFTEAINDKNYEDANFLLLVIEERALIVVNNEKKRIENKIKKVRDAVKKSLSRLKELEKELSSSEIFDTIDEEISQFVGL